MIQYTTYRFNRPPFISSDDHENLKEILTEITDYNINSPSIFIETFKGELVFLSIRAVGLIIELIDLAVWLSWRGGLFFSLFSFVSSMLAYLSFISDKWSYYGKLKRDEINLKIMPNSLISAIKDECNIK